jgi:DNA ligase-1
MLANSYAIVKKGKMVKKDKMVNVDVKGWWMSEKFDGYRAVWNGTAFQSRNGNIFKAPSYVLDQMPSIPLDGELFAGRGNYETLGLLRRNKVNAADWKKQNIQFLIFDAPTINRPFEERIKELKNIIARECGGRQNCFLQFVKQTKVLSDAHILKEFKAVLKKKGEGIMLRKPRSKYRNGRTSDLLKVKPEHDMECTIVAHLKGTGKNRNKLGKYKCKLPNGTTFKVGSGLTDAHRDKPLKIGTVITIAYTELTANKVPRHPRYLRVRGKDK